MKTSRSSRWPFAFLILVAATVSLLGPLARSGLAQTRPPTVVAVLDINQVLDQLDEKTLRQQELEVYIHELEDRVNNVRDDLRRKAEELEVLPPEQPEHGQTLEEVVRLRVRAEVEQNLAERLAEERRKRLQLDLFRKIADATKRFAEREGIDIVISDDSKAGIPEDAPAAQVSAAILSRRILFVSPGINISDEVASMMNAEYKARGGP